MTEQLYFTIGFGFFLWFNFGTLKYIFLCLVAYVFDEKVRKISDKDFSFPFSVAVKGNAHSADFGLVMFVSLIFSLLWPLFAVVFLIFAFFRTLRFFVRMTKGLKKLSSVAHSHKDDKVVVEEIGEIKF